MRFANAPADEGDASAAQVAWNPVSWRGPAIVFALALALYLWTFPAGSDGLILGNDVVAYAHALVAGAPQGLWNPHHLLYHPLAAALHAVLPSGEGPPILAVLRAHQVVSALGGALAVAIVMRFAVSRCGLGPGSWVTAVFALSAGNWLYAAVGESYLPATAATAGLLAHAAGARLDGRSPRPLAVTAWLTAAVLLRSDALLVLPALALLVPARTLAIATACAGAALAAGIVIAWSAAGVETGLVPWVLGPAAGGDFGTPIEADDWRIATGVLGLTLLFLPLRYAAFLLATWLFGVAALVPVRRLDGPALRVLAALVLFGALRTLFFVWWQPGNLEFHAGTLVPLALGAATVLHPRPRRISRYVRAIPMFACLSLVATGNALLLVIPNRAADVARSARTAIEWAGEGGLVCALDRLEFYALLREAPEGVGLVDGSDIASRSSLEDLAAIHARIDRTLERGKTVVFVRDVVLVQRLGFDAWPVEGYGDLVGERIVLPVTDAADRRFLDVVRDPRAAGGSVGN